MLFCQTVKAFLADMMSRDHGHIVTMSSAGGLFGVPGLGDYGASKAAAVGFHESLRAELYALNKSGVYMTLVCPFFINTGMFTGCQTRSLLCLSASCNSIWSFIRAGQINMLIYIVIIIMKFLMCILQ